MDSFEEFLREVTPHNIQHQVSLLKKQSVLWSEDTLVQIVNCIFEKVSAETSDLIYLYVYTCKMMLEFEVKKIGSNTKVTTVTFEDVMQSRAGFHLTEILMKQEKGKQMKSMAGKCAGNGLGAVCSFLSQLFVQDVLSSDTLLFCIHALMAHNTEVTWQCLSKILKNSFVHLESLGTSRLFKRVFQRIYEKIQGKHFSVQTRFMLCDLNDLRVKNQETVEAQFYTFDKIRRQQPMSVNHQQALLYRMQPQAGQMHSMGFGIPSAAAPRTAPMQPASAPTIAPGSAGPRIMQHGTASGAHYGMQNPSFVPQHTMMQPTMFTSRTTNQYPQAAPPISFPYFPATKSVQQNQGYYPPASQIPQVMQTQPPQSRNERKEKILSIMDPTSGEDLTESIVRERDGVVIPASNQVAGVGASSSPPQSVIRLQVKGRPSSFLPMVCISSFELNRPLIHPLPPHIVSNQVASEGSSSIPSKHKEPQRTSLQESRRIQIEFLTKVSQVASYPGSSELSKMAQPEDGAQPKGPVLAQIETARPVVTPAVPAQISKPPVTTEETLADASPPSVAASETTPSEQVVVSDPKQEEQQVEEDAVEKYPANN
ncbi:hypothetical protein BSL78_08492 [Apostichopus japonicus]|uniref:MIF4G domain-containing protein n=1 Tax=Stichopus japonicus TaxID=307972 RepID=A0A2G8L2X8_STIJA|nr:hypothetical protein BSL78_08492 [Apostichopus japonicus]